MIRLSALLPACLAVSAVLAAEEAPPFAVREYRVLGNAVLAGRDIEAKLYPLLGEGKTIADVEIARQTLEALYRDHGYGAVYVDIPEQDVNEGVVRLKVTEGKIDRVLITGARYYANGRIREAVPSLQKGSALYLPALQADLGTVNSQAARDRQITPVLKAGRLPGTVDVELKVKDSLPAHVTASVTDRYSANTSKTRLNVQASYDNLFQRYHSLSLQYQTAPEVADQVRVLGATYLMPVGNGDMIAAYGVDTNSSFAGFGDSGGFSVLGAGRIYGLRYIKRLPAAGGTAQSLTFGVDDKNFRDNIELADNTKDVTPIHYTNWQLGWSYNSFGERTTGVNVTANLGLRGLGNSTEEFAFKRYLARPNYFYLRADAQHEEPLFAGVTVFGRLQGQYAPDPLISNEQLSLGGAESVRGYLESAQLGDLGLGASVEFRSPSFHKYLGSWMQRAILFAFADAGVLSRLEALPGENTRATLSSAGVGLRIAGFGNLVGALDWAYPFEDSGSVLEGDSRIHFQLQFGL